MKYKKIETAIKNAKNKLIKKADEIGIYENFGQKELRVIEENYIDSSSYTRDENSKRNTLQLFDEWCSNYTGN